MKFGRYMVRKELGKGAMGVVYQAHDPNLDLNVALKVLRHDRVVSESFSRRFLSEAKALGRLDRANIVRVFNVDEDKGSVYIAMEFVEGEPLSEIMQKKKFSPEEIIHFGVTIAETLDYAHKKGIVHRDVKPSNILIRKDGFLKITDFGIAHIHDPSAPEQTQDGEILGTPAYMSPEQVMSRPVDGRSDLFSLGIILYEMCSGKRPFSGGNISAIFNAITNEEPVPLTRINHSIPHNLSQAIMKCLKKRPDERFRTGTELSLALKECLAVKKQAGRTAQPGAKTREKIAFLLVGIVLFLSAIGGGVYYFIESGQGRSSHQSGREINSAALQVDSIPSGAQVFINGTFRGKTPLNMNLPVGKYQVTLSLADHLDWEAQVQLTEGDDTPLMVNLVRARE